MGQARREPGGVWAWLKFWTGVSDEVPGARDDVSNPYAAAVRHMAELHRAQRGDAAHTVLFSFLDSATALAPPEFADTDTTRRLLPFFLLGVIDSWRQVEACDTDTFHRLIEDVFSRYGVTLPGGVAEYVTRAKQQVAQDPSLHDAMTQGGTSLGMFVGDRDAGAASDLAALLLQANLRARGESMLEYVQRLKQRRQHSG